MRRMLTALRRGLMLGLVALAAASASSAQEADAEALAARLLEAEQQIAELQARIDEMALELARLRAERDRFERVVRPLGELTDPLEADRRLLIELRRELPETRAEAVAYLQRMQRLALVSDPVRLGPLASRVMQAAPVYLDWREQTFASSEEAARAFARSGARGFTTAFENFRNAILLTVSNRLDALLQLLEW
jgi:vacuolar-type H+-ATPase subunit I/STV1